MSERSRGLSSLARSGFSTARAEEQLRAGGWWDDHGAVDGSQPVLQALSRAADPDVALHGLDRLREALGDGWTELADRLRTEQGLRGRLLGVLGASTALADFLAANPGSWRRLGENDRDPSDATKALFDAVRSGATNGAMFAGITGNEAISALQHDYRALLLDVAAEDLGHTVEPELPVPSYERITARLTELAEAALRAALAVATSEVLGDPDGGDRTPACRLTVVAMGKCGGRELNYVSDVDVVFVGDGDIDVATRLASATMRVAGQAAFEVDAALRPEGKAGALVRTLDGYRSYYKRWARTWEFQALLKARPIAGDAELGQSYSDAVQPMVWSAAEREDFVVDVRSMRRRVERHVPANVAERELKLGHGGLRDVEFAVQLLQLVHGRSDERLRSQSTVEALKALGEGGYVGREDAAGLGESYQFLRVLEHCLQLRKLRRTHLFPEFDDEADLRWLARSAGIKPSRGRAAHQVLLAEFHQHVKRIRRLHEKLFYRPLLEAVARVPTGALRLTTKDAVARLAALGYAAPDGALKHISALTSG
ncbi:MAG: bifunctional [glutamine synthetase] adenylyltransferase/[glutamine synthetase]-adenylyl-L-tyrosine phosphorylase, partial [Sciscionella sp.]